MKMLKIIQKRIEISPFFVLTIVLAFISGRFIPIVTFIILAFVHELGHISAAIACKIKVDKIKFLPFGFFCVMEDLDTIHYLKSFIIILCGPCTYFISLFLLKLFFQLNMISLITYQQGIYSNNLIFLFNLLPIIPLDGSKILKIFLELFLPYKTAAKILTFLSLLSLFVLIYINISSFNYLVLIFLIISQVEWLKNKKINYLYCLIKRLSFNPYKKDKIHNKMDLYRGYVNYQIDRGMIHNEEDLINKILKKL